MANTTIIKLVSSKPIGAWHSMVVFQPLRIKGLSFSIAVPNNGEKHSRIYCLSIFIPDFMIALFNKSINMTPDVLPIAKKLVGIDVQAKAPSCRTLA